MAILKNLKEDEKIFLEIFGLKCVSNHSKSIPETKIFEIFSILDPRKWPHNEPKWTKTPKTSRKIFFPVFSFYSCISSTLGSFCTIPHYPRSYNTEVTILDLRKWPNNEQKWTKTPKTGPKIFFPIFSFYSCIFLCFGVIFHHPALS